MNNFSKEYIDLANCKEIQGLRTELENFDYTMVVKNENIGLYKDFKMIACLPTDYGFHNIDRKMFYWLPTGDDLDQEIIKICKENHFYQVHFISPIWTASIYRGIPGDELLYSTYGSKNPLIAKIKLLLNLLRSKDVY